GPTKPALLLLCCLGTWLSAHALSLPTLPPEDLRQILRDLQRCSGKLLSDYKNEVKLPWEMNTQKKYELPCFTPGFEAANNISVILAHLKQIMKCKGSGLNNGDMSYTIQQLEKLRYGDTLEPQVPTCNDTKPFDYKTYILETLEQFSLCME
ncbi:Interleukin-31, partial [Heterocephalus glaber]